jgi:hypothetical protein
VADDLIQRLRDEQTDGWAGDACAVSCALADEAAARIEALEAENTRLRALLDEALEEVKKHREMRKRLDRRIHNQRKAWRDNWQVIEKRAVIPAHLGSWRERARIIMALMESVARYRQRAEAAEAKLASRMTEPRNTN